MLIDSHAHLTDGQLYGNVDAILQAAELNGVERVITIGTSLSDNDLALELCDLYSGVFACVGVYPDEMPTTPLAELEQGLKKHLRHPKVVGIGETGIDIPKNTTQEQPNISASVDLQRQTDLFELHIRLALEHNLPLTIHNRNADELVLTILSKYAGKGLKGVFHCFTSPWEVAEQILALGFYISFSGIITYPSGKDLLETVSKVPNDRFLVETDAPYLAPQSHRGEINKPEYVKITAQKIAETKQITLSEASKFASENTTKLFFQGPKRHG